MPAAGSRPRTPWPPCPASHPRPDSLGKSKPSHSGGDATSNSETLSATSLAIPATPTPGPLTSTNAPEPEATTTPTPSASSAEPGPTSSGDAGKTTSPTTRTATTPSNESSTNKPPRPPNAVEVDTGQLMPRQCLAVGVVVASVWTRRTVRVGLPGAVDVGPGGLGRRREWSRRGLHRPACMDRGVRPRCGLDWSGSHFGAVCWRRPHSTFCHACLLYT